MRKTPLLTWIALTLLTTFSAWTFYRTTGKPRIAYVRSGDLVYGYTGMKEAQDNYQALAQQMQANVDTLQFDFQRAVNSYQNEFAQLTKQQQQEREQQLGLQERSLQQYMQAMQQKSKEEEQRMTEGVLNQINAFVETYGKEKGYDIIFGTTASGNLLYGCEAIDISKEVLAALNAQYGKSPAPPSSDTLGKR